jgi:hypothetical protein
MAQQTINTGTAANAKNGDPLRTAFTKINQNFTELYAGGASETQLTNGSKTVTLCTDGNLTLPDTGKILTYTDGSVELQAGGLGGASAGLVNYNSNNQIQVDDQAVYVITNVLGTTANNFIFGTNGVLALPGILKINAGVNEKFQALTGATGTVTHDCSLGQVFYHTSPSANWTANFTNLNLSTTYATAITLIIVQGGTGYYPNIVQIGGVAQTIKWQANTNPTPSTSRTDVVTFSIINNSGTYSVLGQLTGF